MSTEERASRLENLVAPLPISEWGQQTPLTSQSTETAAKSSVPSVVKSGAQTPHKDARPAKFEAEKYDGASSDSDSSDEAMPGEEGLAALDEEDGERDEDEPSVMDEDAMLDMGEEMDEFLKFATETLGLSEEQYQGILGERRQRGGEPVTSRPVAPSELPRLSQVSYRSFRARTGKGEKDERRALAFRTRSQVVDRAYTSGSGSSSSFIGRSGSKCSSAVSEP